MAASIMAPMAIAMPPKTHDIGAKTQQFHRAERHQYADRQHDDCHQRAAEMQQEDDADQRHHNAFLQQRVLEGFDRGVDQIGTIVYRNDFDRARQTARDFLEALFYILDCIERIDAKALQHDAAGDLAFPIEFSNASPLGYEMKDGKIANVEEEAELVRSIFRRYLELGSVNELLRDLRERGIRTKTRLLSTGATRGRHPVRSWRPVLPAEQSLLYRRG
jgi:hypothetical protein